MLSDLDPDLFASQRHPTQTSEPGDFALYETRQGNEWNPHRLVIVDKERQSHAFRVLRHPLLAGWMVQEIVPGAARSVTQMDLFDSLWSCRPWVGYPTKEDAAATMLMRFGFVSPVVTKGRKLVQVTRAVEDAEGLFLEVFSDAEDHGTVLCDGCDACSGDYEIHRILIE